MTSRERLVAAYLRRVEAYLDRVGDFIQVVLFNDDLAPGGGFVFTQVHNVQPDVPPENVLAMLDAVRMHGGY